jgi:hypothetical protein
MFQQEYYQSQCDENLQGGMHQMRALCKKLSGKLHHTAKRNPRGGLRQVHILRNLFGKMPYQGIQEP